MTARSLKAPALTEADWQAQVVELARLLGWRHEDITLARELDRPNTRSRIDSYINRTPYCWHWTGKPNVYGYGRIRIGRRIMLAHRVVWTIHRGPIPVGLVLDHRCRNKMCVRPDHLDVCTNATNIQRGFSPNMLLHKAGTCRNGHDLTTEASRRKDGRVVYCKACRRERRRAAA